jgi:hypothetical protein
MQTLCAAAVVVGVCGLALTSGGARRAAAANPNTYNLSAEANALDVTFIIPNVPLGIVVEAGPYGASAALNSIGESLSDAGAPYSPTIYSVPGAVNGLATGQLPPLPPLPGYVSASYPGTPSDSESQAGYHLTATSSPYTAQGAVALGVQPPGSGNATMFASAETTANNDGSVQLSGTSGLDALSVEQLFDLANVSSSLSMTQQANGQPVVTSKTDLGTITLLGKSTGLGSTGLGLLGVNAPINLSTTLIDTLNTLLSKAGVTFTYLPQTFTYTDGSSSTGTSPDPAKTLESIDSGALKVSVIQNIPGQGEYGVTYVIGRVYLSTTNTPGVLLPTAPTGSGSVTGSGPISSSGTVTTSPSSVASGAGIGGTLPTPASSAVTPTTTPTPSLATQPTYALIRGPSVMSFYLMLVLGALCVLLGSQAIRYLSVRLALSGRPET